MIHEILQYDGKIINTEKLRLWAKEYSHLPIGNVLQQLYLKARKYPKIRLKLGPNFREKLNPLCGLNGLDRFWFMRMPEGMNKPLNDDEYKLITRTVINTLKQNDIAFSMPWKTRLEKGKKYYTIAYRWDRKIPYKGKINQLVLAGIWPFTLPLNNPYFLTKGQIKKAGGKLKPGAEGKPAFFYNVLYRTPKKLRDRGMDFRTYKRAEMRKYLMDKAGIKPEEADKYISYYCTVPFLKHYIVYNGDDVEGIDFKLNQKTFEGEISGTHVYESKEKNPVAEAIAKAYPEPQPKIRHKFQDEAYYNPTQDVVMMPQMKQFKNSAQYYGTLFHELVHSTGHPSRLNRLKKTKFGEKDYAFEELVAELGAVYLSGLAGFLYDNIKNSAAYLKSWKSRLIKNMQDDDRFIVMAASKAQKAVDFITENLDRSKLEKLKKQSMETGMNMPGLDFPGEILEVENKYAQLGIKKRRRLAKKFLKNIFSKKPEVINSFLDKPIRFVRENKVLGKNILGRRKHPLTPITLLGYENLIKLLENGFLSAIEPPKPNHIKDFNAKAVYVLESYLKVNGKTKKIRITVLERNHEFAFYFLKEGDLKYNSEIQLKKEILPLTTGPLPIKGRTRKQDLHHKDKSKNPKSQDPDKKNNKGLEAPAVINLKTLKNKRFQTWKLPKEPLATFLGDIERKENGSIAVTLDAPQGAGKTRMLFQFADMFARNGHKVLFFSLEEHPESRLFVKKVKEYISPKAEKNIYVTGEVPKNWRDIIRDYDIILIDSWNKLYKEVWEKEGRRLDFDYDLRRRYDGKLFIVVFQRTQDGKMRGGSQAQFDGDIILKIAKHPDFRQNEVYYDKNRYMIDNYRWNISKKQLKLL